MALSPDSANKNCRVFFYPSIVKGRLIPMADFAKLLAVAHPDIEHTIVMTPDNVALIDSLLGQSRSFGRVQILTYSFLSDVSNTSSNTNGVGSELLLMEEKLRLFRSAHKELLCQYKPDAVAVDLYFV